MSDIEAIQVVESGSWNYHSDTSRAVEQFEAKKGALPSICVDDIPLSDIDRFVADETVRPRQHLGTLPVYDSGHGLSFDSVVFNDPDQDI